MVFFYVKNRGQKKRVFWTYRHQNRIFFLFLVEKVLNFKNSLFHQNVFFFILGENGLKMRQNVHFLWGFLSFPLRSHFQPKNGWVLGRWKWAQNGANSTRNAQNEPKMAKNGPIFRVLPNFWAFGTSGNPRIRKMPKSEASKMADFSEITFGFYQIWGPQNDHFVKKWGPKMTIFGVQKWPFLGVKNWTFWRSKKLTIFWVSSGLSKKGPKMAIFGPKKGQK